MPHMMLKWFAVNHRLIFFAGVLAAYLGILFGFAYPQDEAGLKLATRIAVPLMELGLVWLVCSVLAVGGGSRRGRLAGVLYVAIPLAVTLIYAAQIYSLYTSGNFITVLAIQNSAEARIVRKGSMYLTFALAAAWWLLFVTGYVLDGKVTPAREGVGQPARANAWRIGLSVVLLIVLARLFGLQRDTGVLEAGYRQAPLTAFARSYYDAKRSAASHSVDGVDAIARGYPLVKSSIYNAALPFKSKGDISSAPNVIVIFTEGTSARLLGCYGGTYPGLTPNIDRLARVSMRVTNYYNHTAATYRALQGQMVSGYPAAGGDDDTGAGSNEGGEQALSSSRYRSISMILHDNNYKTYFISPHHNSVGLNTLLRNLSFDKVYSFEDVARDVVPGNRLYFVEGALSDNDVFLALHNLMNTNALGGSGHPFFIGLYNFGTHAFLDIMPNGEKYGDGSNATLNKLHNYDQALGKFLDYFFASPYAKNTILIVTADHATYPEQAFRSVAGDDYRPLFVDRVPLIIYDPTHQLPAVYDAQGSTSIDFAPTLMHLLGVQRADNSFLGISLFERDKGSMGFAAIGNEFYATDSQGAYPAGSIPVKYAEQFSIKRDQVQAYYQLERENRVFPAEQAMKHVDASIGSP
jgi:phosphoglycerol transferase MdoB-like AlkP superfamily enzyme